MRLDGYEVLAGDAVYDLLHGDGRIKSVTADDHAVVVFGQRFMTFDERGVGPHGRRTLYWHNPVLVVPMKDEAQWSLQRRLNAAIAAELRPGFGSA